MYLKGVKSPRLKKFLDRSGIAWSSPFIDAAGACAVVSVLRCIVMQNVQSGAEAAVQYLI